MSCFCGSGGGLIRGILGWLDGWFEFNTTVDWCATNNMCRGTTRETSLVSTVPPVGLTGAHPTYATDSSGSTVRGTKYQVLLTSVTCTIVRTEKKK